MLGRLAEPPSLAWPATSPPCLRKHLIQVFLHNYSKRHNHNFNKNLHFPDNYKHFQIFGVIILTQYVKQMWRLSTKISCYLTGLICDAVDLLEFRTLDCTCPAGKALDSTLMPRCTQTGIWSSPDPWPLCVVVTTTLASTTVGVSQSTTAALSGSTGGVSAGTSSAGDSVV